MDDLLEATYQRYRAEIKAGKDMSDQAKRLQMRKDIENDPDLEVDRNAPKDGLSDQELDKRFPELAKWKDEIQAKRYDRKNQSKIPPNYIEAAFDISKTPSATYVLARGNYLAPGAEVQPGLPLVLDNPANPLQFPDPTKHPEWNGTNRRLILANWMVSKDNPLVPRVFVNRVWQWHFGEGIVRSVDDFGMQGSKPTNPELLDYLATSFEEHNWDLKWLFEADHDVAGLHAGFQRNSGIPGGRSVRQAAVAQSSAAPGSGNHPRLHAAGQRPVEREDVRQAGAHQARLRTASGLRMTARASASSAAASTSRRPAPGGSTSCTCYDCPDMTSDNQTERFRSALPTQSLAMMNSPLIMRTSKAFAQKLIEQSNNNYDVAVNLAFEEAYNRPATAKEQEIAKKAIASETEPEEGLRLFVQAMFGANNFLYSN